MGLVTASLVTGVAFALASPAGASEVFGVEAFESSIEGQEHSPAIQAGSHPYAVSTTIMFNHRMTEEEEAYEENGKEEEVPLGEPEVFAHIYGNPRDLEMNLPAGLVVNPAGTSMKCTEAQLESKPAAGGSCPAGSTVGIVTAYISGSGEKVRGAVYNMVPPPGVPAEFGVDPGEVGLVLHVIGQVRTGGDHGFSADISEIGQKVSIYGLKLALWGDPSAASHDAQRGICASRGKVEKGIEEELFAKENLEDGKSTEEYRFSCPAERTDTPLLTMPTSCTGEALTTSMSVDSWQESGALKPDGTTDLSDPRWQTATSSSPPVTGCEKLAFTPTLDVQPVPAAVAAETPTGLNVDLKIPHEESTEGLAGAELKQLTVALPPGMAISLSAANGLGACTPGEIALRSSERPACPEAAEIGEADVVTPLLEHPLKGAVYMAQPETFEESLIGLYVVVEGSGVAIKLAGRATLDSNTGQVAIAFGDLPQLPLSEIRLSLFGGPRAALVTPPGCGTYTIASQLTPWSAGAPARRSSRFTVGSNCGEGFDPSFTAGTTNNRAGAFSPFSVTVSRQDGEQRLSSIRVVGPPGLVGMLQSVAQCPEPQAALGECGAGSEIGEAAIGAGSGVDAIWIKGAKIYLTGPYGGSPVGLSLVIGVVAGPFDLGQEVVRARVEVNSHTGQIEIESDPLPTMVRGVPLDIRTVNMTIDRAGFMFNPTSCAPLSVTGTIGSGAGASVAVASPFEAVNCASLPFKPKFTVSTQARTSRAHGASLSAKLVSGAGQANVAKVRVILPVQLPARLSTLQRACTAAAFDANPASCPAASIVGTATALTPMLAHPLTGPVYLLSRGATFPDLVLVVQGEGIVVYLDGNLDIKHHLTSATFNSIPDIPVAEFTLVLPEGPHAILAADIPARAKRGMCGQRLRIPTAITAQDGALQTQTTRVTVTGCPKRARRKASTKKSKTR